MELFRRSSRQPHPADWSQAPQATKLLALLVAILTAAGIACIHLASRSYEVQGPSRIARNSNNSTLINAYEKLFLVDAQQRVTKLTATDLGLVGPINSIRARGQEWLLGDDDSGLLYRCDAVLHDCRPLFPTRKERMFSRAHGSVELNGRLIISDSERHRLRIYDGDGKEIAATRTQPVELCYPNDVIVVDGMLYVTDTNNFRIARIDPTTFDSQTFIQTADGRAIERSNCTDLSSHVAERGDAYANLMLDTVNTVGRPTLPVARPSRILPASIIHTTTGDWWVVQMKGLMTLGDVVVYSGDGQAKLRVQLPEDSEPTNMLETADGVLVTDPTLARIYDVDLDGRVRGDWGPAQLKAEWQQILTTRARWERLQPMGWVLIGLGIGCGALVIVRELLRTKGNWNPKTVTLMPVDVTPQHLDAAEMWLATTPTFQKRTRVAAWILIAGLLGALVFVGPSLYSLWISLAKMSPVAMKITGLVVVMLAIPVALMTYTIRILFLQIKARLGTNGYQLLFDAGNGKVQVCDFDRVLAGQHTLLTDKRFISIYTKQGKPIYPLEQLQSLILARIPRTNFVKPSRFFYTSLQRGNLAAWSSIIAIAIIVVLQFGGVLFPQWSQYLNRSIQAWLRR